MKTKKIEDHHVFPRAALEGLMPAAPATLRECVLNRTLIDRDTNRRIQGKAPSVYLAEILAKAKVHEKLMVEILDSHLLPSEAAGPLYRDDFNAFLETRQELLGKKILDVTS